ncbi:MAG: MXAN_6640 family putative metalloprotease, partial [Gaiellaceae bacterium]
GGSPGEGRLGRTAWSRRLRRLGALCALVALVGAAAVAPAPAAVAPTDALEQALAILAPAPEHAARFTRRAADADKRELTLVLRDLAADLAGLTPMRRSTAERLLARPTQKAGEGWGPAYTVPEARLCDANLCIHWLESTVDAPPGADGDPATVPEWVRTTLGVFQHVWAAQVDTMGYRAPKTDALSPDNGGDGRLDVYLADVGDTVNGYCATDDPDVRRSAASAYCVVDNDFARAQFHGPTSGLAALEVTAAHEFFHAVQFAYDYLEDSWLMEGSATWIEDEVFDDVDDNRQFLNASPLARSTIPLDVSFAPYHYGAWIFWRYLSETFDPSLVREVWEHADGTTGRGGLHSLAATRAAVSARGLSFGAVFGGFTAANRMPAASYEEGTAYPLEPTSRTWILRAPGVSTGWRSQSLRHLTSRSFGFRPAGAGSSRLRLELRLPPRATGSQARLLVFRRSGAVSVRSLSEGTGGKATVRVRVRGAVRFELILANASTRIRGCGLYSTPFSCSGKPLDDGRRYSFRATLV